MPIIAGPGDPGSIVDLCAIFINTAADPTDFMSFRYAGKSFSTDSPARGEIRQLANRRRLITQGDAGSMLSDTQQVTLSRIDPDRAAWLRAHIGVIACFRDHVGGKFFGAYLSLPRNIETAYRTRSDVTLSVEQVDFTEAV